MNNTGKAYKFFSKFLRYFVLTVVALVSIFPLYWMFCAATNTSLDVTRGTLLPGGYFFENYKNLVATYPVLWTAMKNSFVYAVGTTFLALLVSSLAGYGFEIYHDKFKDGVMSVILLAMMVPFAAIMIPMFTMFSKAGLLNTAIGFILPSIATPFLIMMFRQSSRNFPHEIIEAARIDGLGELAIFFRMYFPTMRSTYAAAMTITFMGAWNNYLWPKLIMNNGQTLTMPMLTANMKNVYVLDYGMMMCGVLISTLPTIIIFFLLQKSFAEGISGSVKG